MHNHSEVARLLEQIHAEYQAAHWALSGLVFGCARHEFISRKMENMQDGMEQLSQAIGQDRAAKALAQLLDEGVEKTLTDVHITHKIRD
jgi:F0F1-type ATP synthase gamma subunit